MTTNKVPEFKREYASTYEVRGHLYELLENMLKTSAEKALSPSGDTKEETRHINIGRFNGLRELKRQVFKEEDAGDNNKFFTGLDINQ